MARERGQIVTCEQMCEHIAESLKLLQPVLRDSYLVHIQSIYIDQRGGAAFSTHDQFVEFFEHRLLPFCNPSRGIKITMIDLDEGSHTNVPQTNCLQKILLLPKIKHCSYFHICLSSEALPVEAISFWLNQNIDAIEDSFSRVDSFRGGPDICKRDEILGKFNNERFLKIRMNRISNLCEVSKHLKKVLFIF